MEQCPHCETVNGREAFVCAHCGKLLRCFKCKCLIDPAVMAVLTGEYCPNCDAFYYENKTRWLRRLAIGILMVSTPACALAGMALLAAGELLPAIFGFLLCYGAVLFIVVANRIRRS